MKHWYVIQTKYNKEVFAEINLIKQNFKTYLQKTIMYTKSKNDVKKVLKPMFSNYIFVSIDNFSKSWKKIKYTRGVRDIVNFDNSFPRVPDEFINELKSKECKGIVSLSKINLIKLGDLCKINNKFFLNYFCTVEKIYKNNKVQVLLNFLGEKIKYLVPKEEIVPTS